MINVIKHFFFVTDKEVKQAKVFDPGKTSKRSLILQAKQEPTQEEHLSDPTL